MVIPKQKNNTFKGDLRYENGKRTFNTLQGH